MRPTSLLRLLIFVLACLSGAAGQTNARSATSTTSPFRITGTVVSSTNGAPIPHSRLTATLIGQGRGAGRPFPAPLDTFEADEHGHFSIPLPSAGAWHLSASARGFVTQAYDEHERFSSAVVLTAAAPTIDLTFPLPEESVISGAVVDEAGEPVRNARVVLMNFRAPGPEVAQPSTGTRAAAQTDDRGVYELADLPPGEYRLMVQAQPWYAAAASQTRRMTTPSDPTPVDPSLDVAYPVTWFPGVDDAAIAETITLHAGENRQADFHLIPIPAVHLRILTPTGTPGTSPTGRPNMIFPIVERISQGGLNGGLGFQPTTIITNEQGQMDVGGLAPGTYQIRLQGPGQEGKAVVVEVAAGSVRTIDMNSPPPTASITLHFEGITDPDDESVQVNLIDPETGRSASPSGQGVGGPGELRRRPQSRNGERVIEALPGRYEVVLRGRQNLYLTGMTAQSAEVAGRYVTVHAGPATLTLRVASGRPTLTGFAKFQGKPSVGAMVILVPATLDDPRNMDFVRRDQSNTDGSFDLPDVIPGRYILVAIDHGWQINWSDPSTLRNYLTHGVAIDLTSGGDVKQNVEAQAP